jgi:hypothetical protein
MKNFDFKKILPHLISLFIFIAVSIIYFSPVLQGKILQQSDIIQSKGMEHEREVYKQKDGKEIYWTNAAFGGMPTYLTGASFPNDYTLKINKLLNFLPRPANFLFLYFFSFYILMMVMRIDWKLAILGSLAFGFSTYYIIIIGVGHLAKVRAIAYFPMVIAGILLVFERKKYFIGFILTTLAVALEINTKHYQMTYYLLFAVLILGFFYLLDAYKQTRLKEFGKELAVLLVAALLALGMNATNILPAQEYVQHSIRGKSIISINPDGSSKKQTGKGLSKDYITEYSYGIAETFNLLIPRFMGGSNGENLGENSHLYKTLINKTDSRTAKDFVSHVSTYWGKQPIVAAPAYIGAVVIFLAFIGLLFYRGKLKNWFIATIIFALLLSWGKNFNFLTDFFIDYVPLYNKFRAVSSIQVLIEFLLPVLAVLGVYSFFTSDLNEKVIQKKLYIALGSLGGLLLIFILMGGSLFTFESPMDGYYAKYGLLDALIADRKAMLTADSWRSLLFILAAGGVLYAYLKKIIKKNIAISLLALLVLLDLAGVDKRYVNEQSFVKGDYYQKIFTPGRVDKEILKDKTYYRVMNFTRNPLTDGLTSYFHKQLGGYHAAKPRRIQDLFDFYLSREPNPEILNMYNVKYFIFQDEKGQTGMQKNENANGNAWFVKEFNFAGNENEEILKLKDINSKAIAVLNEKYQTKLQFSPYKDSLSTIRLTKYHPEKLTYESNNKQDGFAVFSDNYYDNGWTATIDGQPVEIFKTDYSLRGLKIPGGKHKIIFEFKPEIVQKGGKISLLSFLFFLVLAGLIPLKNKLLKRNKTT